MVWQVQNYHRCEIVIRKVYNSDMWCSRIPCHNQLGSIADYIILWKRFEALYRSITSFLPFDLCRYHIRSIVIIYFYTFFSHFSLGGCISKDMVPPKVSRTEWLVELISFASFTARWSIHIMMFFSLSPLVRGKYMKR